MTRKRTESFCMTLLGLLAIYAAWYASDYSYWSSLALGVLGQLLVWAGWAWTGGEHE